MYLGQQHITYLQPSTDQETIGSQVCRTGQAPQQPLFPIAVSFSKVFSFLLPLLSPWWDCRQLHSQPWLFFEVHCTVSLVSHSTLFNVTSLFAASTTSACSAIFSLSKNSQARKLCSWHKQRSPLNRMCAICTSLLLESYIPFCQWNVPHADTSQDSTAISPAFSDISISVFCISLSGTASYHLYPLCRKPLGLELPFLHHSVRQMP